MEFSLLWTALTGIVLMFIMLRLVKPFAPDVDLVDLSLGAGVVGLVVGRLGAMVLQGSNPLTSPVDLFFVRGGVDTGWASMGALVFLGFKLRGELPAAADVLAPPTLAGLAGWHAGCVFRTACAGTVTTLPWGITTSGSDAVRHPVELYTAAAFLLMAGLLYLAVRSSASPEGVVAGFGLASAGAIRLVTEPLRSDGTWPVSSQDVSWSPQRFFDPAAPLVESRTRDRTSGAVGTGRGALRAYHRAA